MGTSAYGHQRRLVGYVVIEAASLAQLQLPFKPSSEQMLTTPKQMPPLFFLHLFFGLFVSAQFRNEQEGRKCLAFFFFFLIFFPY